MGLDTVAVAAEMTSLRCRVSEICTPQKAGAAPLPADPLGTPTRQAGN